jgi:hypothetical protein
VRAIVAGRGTWAVGLLVSWLMATAVARAAPPSRSASLPQIEVKAPADCATAEQFAALLRARLAAGATAGARLVLELVVSAGANVRASLVVARGSGRIERRLEAPTCTEALSALALVAALILDPTPPPADQPSSAPPRAGRGGAARTSSGASSVAAGSAAAASSRSAQPAAPAAPENAAAPAPEAPPPGASSLAEAPEKAGSSATSPPAQQAASVGVAATPSATRPDDAPRSSPRRGRARFALDAHAGLSMMTGLAPATRPGATLGLGLGGRWPRALLQAELDARAAFPQRVESSQGVARFGFWGAGAKLCAIGLFVSGQLGLSGCAIGEAGVLLASGSETQAPLDSREPWAALGPGLGLSWRSAGRIWLRLGSELLLPLTRPRYTLGGEPLHSVPPVTFRLELALGVKLL